MNIYPISLTKVKQIDTEIIPSIVLKAVTQRNYFSLINILKRNQGICRQLISFYYETLQVNANFMKNNKSSCCFTIPWITETQQTTGKHIILTPDEMYQLYAWVTMNNRSNVKVQSNFEFLIFSLGNYLTQLRTAQRTINQKQDACCYYSLGINVKNNEQLKQFLRQWIY
jgi:hypothetical protein